MCRSRNSADITFHIVIPAEAGIQRAAARAAEAWVLAFAGTTIGANRRSAMMRMTRLIGGLVLVLAIAAGLLAPLPVAGAVPAEDPVKARLIAEAGSIGPGETVWVSLHLEMQPGWHVYWRNPGDAGLPPEIAWTLPPGFAAGDIVWPTPERFVVGGIGNYGYAGSVDLLVPITAPPALEGADPKPGGAAPIGAHAGWLVCSEICIPGEADLSLDLRFAAAPAGPDPAAAALFAQARSRLPQPAGFATRATASATEVTLHVPAAALAGIEKPTASFFPIDPNIIDAAAEPRQESGPDVVDLVLKRASGPAAAASLPERLSGVLALSGANGSERAYTVSAPLTVATAAASTAAPAAGESGAVTPWWQALLLAFVGGAILNLMPCVFPILSLKLLGLAASVHRAEERRHALAYAAGVVLSFAALGGLLLALRAGGAAIGWGFQLQSPIVVALLAYLLFAMGLSLSGVAEFGGALGGIGSRFAERTGLSGAFATGVLATIVATPCTAPFMGAALGFALLAPPAQALTVFVALGAGLAAPIVLATAIPGAARLLPRPGPWMLWFKQLLAFPLYITVAWLVWVLLQQTAPGDGFLALLGLVLVGFAAWIYGRSRYAEPAGRRFGLGLAVSGIAAALAVAATLAPSAAPARAGASSTGLAYERFSTDRLDRLVAERQPVFVNLTAAWCITCLINERVLDSAAVRRAFAEHEIVAVKGDWTRQDPEITAFLQKFGRSGVPLYLLYDRAGKPAVLPQILSETTLLDAVDRAAAVPRAAAF
jgi:thiol:disulfide interchange protein DsbD